MSFNVVYNYIEIGLWAVIGTCFLISTFLRPVSRNTGLLTALTFYMFSVSDVIEIRTGTWWRPWWLFVMKAACVASMFVLFLVYLKNKKARGR